MKRELSGRMARPDNGLALPPFSCSAETPLLELGLADRLLLSNNLTDFISFLGSDAVLGRRDRGGLFSVCCTVSLLRSLMEDSGSLDREYLKAAAKTPLRGPPPTRPSEDCGDSPVDDFFPVFSLCALEGRSELSSPVFICLANRRYLDKEAPFLLEGRVITECEGSLYLP